jgi:hypothetical protein
MKNIFLIAFCFLAVFSANTASAQCHSFTKKECLPQLKPFTHNGQYNSVELAPGETAELQVTFFTGMDYKIAVCTQKSVGDHLIYKVMDSKNKVVFNNEEHNNAMVWEFQVESTQTMTIEVTAPPRKKNPNGLSNSGCASVMIGFKQQ